MIKQDQKFRDNLKNLKDLIEEHEDEYRPEEWNKYKNDTERVNDFHFRAKLAQDLI